MNGLGQNEDIIFLGMSNGKITLRCSPDAKNAVERTKKDSDDKYYVQEFGYVEGFLEDIKKKKNEEKNFTSMHLYLNCDGDKYILSLPHNSSVSRYFYNFMKNLDFSKKIRFCPRLDDGGYTMFFMKQDEEWIKKYYTKDNPQGKPEWERKEFNGEMVWDKGEEYKFYWKIIEEELRPLVAAAKAERNKNASPAKEALMQDDPVEVVEEENVPITSGGDDDDLPF